MRIRMNDYLFAEEAAALAGCSVATLYNRIARHAFPAASHRVKNRVAWARSAVLDAIACRAEARIIPIGSPTAEVR
jgi:predicted DNA-binding transcriptional regulator AlpA